MGIFGYLDSSGRTAALPIANEMGRRMRHVDTLQVETASPSPPIAFGRIDTGITNPAPQPRRSDDGRVWVWVTGEFFHDDDRRGQLERSGLLHPGADAATFALAVYRQGGAEALTHLNGEFVVAVWDARTSEFCLVNDRFGLHPHYYAHLHGTFVFGPELKAVVTAPQVPRRIDRVAIAEYMRFQFLLGDRTWFEDVRVVPPGSVIRYQIGEDRLRIDRYWDWDQLRQLRVTFDEAAEEGIRLFQRAVNARIRSHRIGVHLSGGLDSRMILEFIDGQVPVSTLTFGQAGCRDVLYAERVARRLGTDHHWIPFTDGRWVREYEPLHFALTEGHHPWMHLHGLSTLEDARRLMDVNLSGWRYGGTLPTSDVFDSVDPPGASESAVLRALFDVFCQKLSWPGMTEGESETLLAGTKSDDLRGVAFESLRDWYRKTANYPPDRRARCFIVSHDERRGIMNLVVFMRCRLEVRCPWLDYDFLTFIWSLPHPIFRGLDLRRAILTRRNPAMARIPYDKDDKLPHERALIRSTHAGLSGVATWINRRIRFRAARPTLYADYEQWLRTDLAGWAEDLLLSPRTLERGLFSADAVRAIWQRHLSGNELWTIGKLAPLMTIERVMRTLFDEAPAPMPAEALAVTRHGAGPG